MLLQTLKYDTFWLYSVSAVVMVSLITAVLSCLCCRRKQEIKNDLLGLEGMVKLTNPEDSLANSGLAGSLSNSSTMNGAQGATSPNPSDFRPASASGGFGSDSESSSKRTSNAPHRSLPDIPIGEPPGDNNSELYATVGDKVQDLPQGRSPTASLKKQASVSQHSSISQADDISSPYARVRSPPHAYDKLRRTEHPYAQVNQPGNVASSSGSDGGPSGLSSRTKPRDGDEEDNEDEDDNELISPISRRESTQNLDDRETSTVDIPAASAIAGRVSASQDLPYMTPPIVQPSTQHFSGDSQDSSKGYTSISVREPLANLLPQNLPTQSTAKRRQILSDSHYATVSDDSDEMYAAIDDPDNHGDLYTSGSETYAQIQPPNAVTVSVEINTGASSRPQVAVAAQAVQPTGSREALQAVVTPNSIPVQHSASSTLNRLSNHSNTIVTCDEHAHGMVSTHIPPAAVGDGGLRAQSFVQHSRQASSSSCTSSVGNLGSPKPEKRQANSPLPPTPKTLKHQANNFFSNSNQSMLGAGSSVVSSTNMTTIGAGRTSGSSAIEGGIVTSGSSSSRESAVPKLSNDSDVCTIPNGPAVCSRPKKNPSKDLEGMYAKVMKKNKLSKVPSQNSSPVALRKDGSTGNPLQKQSFSSESDMSQLNGADVLHGPSSSPITKLFATTSIGGEGSKQQQRNSTGRYDPGKDPGYETIPGDSMKGTNAEHGRKSADYAQIQKHHRSTAATAGTAALTLLDGTGTVLPMSAGVGQEDNEPGYESLPDSCHINNDPGYETLNHGSQRTESDSDPNYEILRPANSSKTRAVNRASGRMQAVEMHKTVNRDNDGYSSIRDPGRFSQEIHRTHDDTDTESTPGYSSIKEKDDYDPGYSVISERMKPPQGHDYASITEDAKKRKPNINNNIELDESDIYSSIPHNSSGSSLTLTSPLASSSTRAVQGAVQEPPLDKDAPVNFSTISERPSSTNLGALSSSPGYSSISETRTTPSSADGDGDGSTSSPDQLTSYNKQNNTNTTTTVTTTNSLSRISSNYESLTGSESDPNYESVKYLNVKENPYERLHNESSAAGSASNMLGRSVTNDSLTTDSNTATPTANLSAATIPNPRTPDSDSGGAVVAVSDYFHV